MIKNILKRIWPKSLFFLYHKFLVILAAFVYRWPSRKLIVIGVTGTGGKSTVVNFIGRILEKAGYKCGWATTFNFKIAEKEWINTTKMTMLGRFALQKLLAEMVKARCQYAIIETSSEGIAQGRHLGINYDVAVFTNLSPEHIESHGGFEKYRQAKQQLFKNLSRRHKWIKGKLVKKIMAVNLDDKNAEYFLKFPADIKYGYSISPSQIESGDSEIKMIKAENIKLNQSGSEFTISDINFKLNLFSNFNIENALAAICVASSQKISLEVCQKALKEIQNIPGRMELVVDKPFQVIVDYAHTPDSLEKVYQLLFNIKNPGAKIIAVLGAAGGGRDKWKRPKLGEIATQYCDFIIITNEDPYDENPEKILSEIKFGILQSKKQFAVSNFFEIIDRREAIKKALEIARPGDIVIITGKGCEPWIMGPAGQRIAWDDRQTVKELLARG